MTIEQSKEIRRRWFFIDRFDTLTWRDFPIEWTKKEVLVYLKKKNEYKSNLEKDRIIKNG